MQALGMDFAHDDVVPRHCHAQDQLIYAASGVMQVRSDAGSWVVPHHQALWVPAGVSHEIRMVGEVSMRTLLVGSHVAQCQLIAVSGLLRELVLAASKMFGQPDDAVHARALIQRELDAAVKIEAHVPLPQHARLRAWCQRFLADPAQEQTLEQCGEQLSMSARNVARLFQRELGMSCGDWRARARVMLSQQRLAEGVPVINVALEHGYQSASAFSAVFKRILGHSPSDWQARVQGAARARQH